MTTRIFIFPGQGSQQIGMGAAEFAQFKEMTEMADSELGYSIEELCLRDPQRRLDQTEFTQPALYIVNAFYFLGKLMRDGRLPHFVAGHSLGEYSALFAAGVFDFLTGLKLVKQRGLLMARARDGGMSAVIGLAGDRIRQALDSAGLNSTDIANYNSPNQVVISGPAGDLDKASRVLESAGAQMVKRLKVSAAFHSRYMAGVERSFTAFLQPVRFEAPRIPVLSNVTAEPHTWETMKKNLARQITNPVRWTESVQWLLRQTAPEFVEVGPGNVLTGLVRKTQIEAGLPSALKRSNPVLA